MSYTVIAYIVEGTARDKSLTDFGACGTAILSVPNVFGDRNIIMIPFWCFEPARVKPN